MESRLIKEHKPIITAQTSDFNRKRNVFYNVRCPTNEMKVNDCRSFRKTNVYVHIAFVYIMCI